MTMGRGADAEGAAGGPTRHVPVLLDEVLAALLPNSGGLYLDGTFGAGGYARAILDRASTRLLATDRDPEAIQAGGGLVERYGERLTLTPARFSELGATTSGLGFHEGSFQGVVFDLGVSSMQLDEADRGFSFRRDGPLDMRMSRGGRSAADLVNEESEERLADIFFHFGEERAARRIARAIALRRARQPFASTLDLAEVVARAAPARPGELHPATRSFQALRIAVNEELREILAALSVAERLLAPEGRLVVVSFHSLEDRIVKQFFAGRAGRGRARSRLLPGEAPAPEPSFRLVGPQPVTPSMEEIARNPRARSAKLRAAMRTSAPARGLDPNLEKLANLPVLQQRRRQ
jgi:16S rRNA (cytosine1402-N4)-methyltransferase